tara:strand:+ start:177 stop:2378 length:2202 start_codon:yes stop_codon:yes gene_type:complete
MVQGAVDYELEVFCPGNDDPFNFRPDEYNSFYAPAYDERGNGIEPRFEVSLQHLGGRSCDISLVAFRFSDAGDFLGSVRESFPNVVFTGGFADSGGYFDNEIKLAVGDSACLVNGAVTRDEPNGTVCNPENTLFELIQVNESSQTLLQSANDGDFEASLQLGEGVKKAKFEKYLPDLTGGPIEPGSVIQLDLDIGDLAKRPRCGRISTDEYSDYCHSNDVVLIDVLQWVEESNRLELLDGLASVLSIEGDFAEDGTIVPTEPGFFTVSNGNQELFDFQVEPWDGKPQFFAWPKPLKVKYKRGESENRILPASVPGFVFVKHDASDQPIDIDIHVVRPEGMKFNWYVLPPRMDVTGEHDVNGDGSVDLTVTAPDGDSYEFSFAEGLTVRRYDPETDELTGVTGDITVARSENYADFELDIGNATWIVIAGNLQEDPHLEFFQLPDFQDMPEDAFAVYCDEVQGGDGGTVANEGGAGVIGGGDGESGTNCRPPPLLGDHDLDKDYEPDVWIMRDQNGNYIFKFIAGAVIVEAQGTPGDVPAGVEVDGENEEGEPETYLQFVVDPNETTDLRFEVETRNANGTLRIENLDSDDPAYEITLTEDVSGRTEDVVSKVTLYEEGRDGFDELRWPHSSAESVSVNITGTPQPTTYSLGTFKLAAEGQNFTIVNVSAKDSDSNVEPYFSGIAEGDVLAAGSEVEFELITPLTGGETASLSFDFEIEETGEGFSVSYRFVSN